MIKLPINDPDTIPWMSKREIPAIKAVLSAWRAMRRDDKGMVQHTRHRAEACVAPDLLAIEHAAEIARGLEFVAAIDERMRKEARNGTGHKK